VKVPVEPPDDMAAFGVQEVKEGDVGWPGAVFELLGLLGFDVLLVQDDQAFALLLQEVTSPPKG
jgi:hypothetical protein